MKSKKRRQAMTYHLASTLEYRLQIPGKGINYAHTKQKTNYKQKKMKTSCVFTETNAFVVSIFI